MQIQIPGFNNTAQPAASPGMIFDDEADAGHPREGDTGFDAKRSPPVSGQDRGFVCASNDSPHGIRQS